MIKLNMNDGYYVFDIVQEINRL